MSEEINLELFATSEALNATEEQERDEASDEPAFSALPAQIDPDFVSFIATLGLQHFSAPEFLVMGGSNASGPCAGRNQPPPRNLWPNIASTARVLDRLRSELGLPIRLTSVYRNQPYNTCIAGAGLSQHMRFNAADFTVSGASPSQSAAKLLELRAAGFFHGGVGLYSSFVHVDARGNNATWGF